MLNNERRKLICLLLVFSVPRFSGLRGLVAQDNAQKMMRNDLDRETMFGNGATSLGDFDERSSSCSYSLHNVRIFARTAGVRPPRGRGRGIVEG